MNIFDSWTVAPRLPCRRPGPMHPKGRAEPDPLHREMWYLVSGLVAP
jgi:hypothetical protein